jgi:hypothetical protein
LLIRRPREVTRLATEALAVFDEADLPGPRALTRLDHATALLMGEQVDPVHAATVAQQAIEIANSAGFESVKQRSEEFVLLARPWAREPAVRHVVEMVRAQRSQRALPAGQEGGET